MTSHKGKNSESPHGYDEGALNEAMSGSEGRVLNDELRTLRTISSSQSEETSAVRGGSVAILVPAISPGGEYDLRGFVKKTKSPVGKARSAEKVLVKARRQRIISSRISTDDKRDGVVTEEVGKKLQQRALCLTITVTNVTTGKRDFYEGQAFLVQNPGVAESVQFCTAKHNAKSEFNKEGEFEACTGHFINTTSGSETDVHLPDRGWTVHKGTPVVLRSSTKWKSGIDVSLGPSLDTRSILHDPYLLCVVQGCGVYDVVDRSFKYKAGTEVAIVAFKRASPSEEKLSEEDLDKTSYSQYFGIEEETTINTGTITHVGKKHIEYNINTCGGFSGAAVVCLEPGADFLKVIAVHAGYKEELEANIGFKLAGRLDNGWWSYWWRKIASTVRCWRESDGLEVADKDDGGD